MSSRLDVLIIGTGLAGLTEGAAVDYKRIGLVARKQLLDGASTRVQSAIAAVLANSVTATARVNHAQDATGRAVQTALEAKIRAHPNITLLEAS